MNRPQLGKLEQEKDLRTYWENEARDFTPWLAEDGNIKLLGETIGVDLVIEVTEKAVGPFSADILCKDTVGNHWVLIENQLEKTDHTHIGQLLTYAAGLNAAIIVWVAKKFTDEHRATLDWLNEITDDSFNFFGLEIELWKIGASAVAPKFNIVSKPNDWSKSVTEGAKKIEFGSLSETKKLQLDYWTAFKEFLIEQESFLNPPKPYPQALAGFSIGRTNFSIGGAVNTWEKYIRVFLSLLGPEAKPHFHLLHKEKAEIEREMGVALEWRENPENKESAVWLRADMDPTNKDQWKEQHKWLKENIELLDKVFRPRINKLDASDYAGDGLE